MIPTAIAISGEMFVLSIGLYLWVSHELDKLPSEFEIEEADTSENAIDPLARVLEHGPQSFLTPASKTETPEFPEFLTPRLSDEIDPSQSTFEDLIDATKEYSEYGILRQRLERVGLNSVGMFENGPIPRSLLSACESLANQPYEMQVYLRKGLASKSVLCPLLNYGTGKWTKRIVDAWRGAIEGVGGTLRDTEEHCIYSARADHVSSRFKLVFRYPFFQTRSAKKNYPIFPIGFQEEIGILVPEHPEYSNAIELCERAEVISNEQFAEKGNAGLAAIEKLMIAIENCDHPIVSRVGYALDEIFLMFLDSGRNRDIADTFGKRLKVIEISPVEFEDQNVTRKPNSITKEARKYGGIYLFDPANDPSDEELLHFPKNRKFILRHNLSIPVGFGFSLPMLQELSNPVFRSLLFDGLKNCFPPEPIRGIEWWHSNSSQNLRSRATGQTHE